MRTGVLAAIVCAGLIAPTRSHEGSCGIDVCFAVDESGMLGAARFHEEVNFVSDVSDAIFGKHVDAHGNPAADSPRFAAWIYDGRRAETIKVTDLTANHQNFKSALALKTPVFNGGLSNMFAGLAACRNSLLDSVKRTRVIVPVTDSPPTAGPGAPKPLNLARHVRRLAAEIRNEGIFILPVGLFNTSAEESGLDLALLEAIASRLAGKPQRELSSFASLTAISNGIANKICNVDQLSL